jgi:hypothetical protein
MATTTALTRTLDRRSQGFSSATWSFAAAKATVRSTVNTALTAHACCTCCAAAHTKYLSLNLIPVAEAVQLVNNATAEIAAAAKFDWIRLAVVGRAQSSSPLNDTAPLLLPWQKPSPAAFPSGSWNFFSATCWFTPRDLANKIGPGVPLGLIDSAVGGTPIEMWTPDSPTASGAGVLYNAMVAPLTGLVVKMVLWYQGEDGLLVLHTRSCMQDAPVCLTCSLAFELVLVLCSVCLALVLCSVLRPFCFSIQLLMSAFLQGENNSFKTPQKASGDWIQYATQFPLMIKLWREAWAQRTGIPTLAQGSAQLPFGFVQIGPRDCLPGGWPPHTNIDSCIVSALLFLLVSPLLGSMGRH